MSLKWPDINFVRKTIVVKKTKNKESKTLPLNELAMGILIKRSKIKHISWLIFTSSTGKKINRYNLKRDFNKVIKKAKIEDFTFHDLRHTFATRLAQQGEDIYRIAKLLGHKDLRSTQRYAHHCVDSLRSGVDNLVGYNLATVEPKAAAPNC